VYLCSLEDYSWLEPVPYVLFNSRLVNINFGSYLFVVNDPTTPQPGVASAKNSQTKQGRRYFMMLFVFYILLPSHQGGPTTVPCWPVGYQRHGCIWISFSSWAAWAFPTSLLDQLCGWVFETLSFFGSVESMIKAEETLKMSKHVLMCWAVWNHCSPFKLLSLSQNPASVWTKFKDHLSPDPCLPGGSGRTCRVVETTPPWR
jgi:hypothetical protein